MGTHEAGWSVSTFWKKIHLVFVILCFSLKSSMASFLEYILRTDFYSKLTIVYKTHSMKPVKLRTESWDGNCRSRKKDIWRIEIKLRQALISNYHDLMQMGNILKKDPIHKQIVATAKRLRSEEDYDLAESYTWALKKWKFLLERILDNYEMRKSVNNRRITENFQCKVNGNKTKQNKNLHVK